MSGTIQTIQTQWPIEGQITQLFGENPLDYTQFGYPGHNALDIAATHGQPCKPMAEGYVEKLINEVNGYGIGVVLAHGGGVKSYYAHAERVLVRIKKVVYFDTELMLCDSTGNSTGDHLHIGWRVPADNPDYSAQWKGFINPLPILRAGHYSIGAVQPTEPVNLVMPIVPALPRYKIGALVTKWLNLRDRPSQAGIDLGDIAPGSVVEVFGYTTVGRDIWFMVKMADGKIGYAAAYYGGSVWMEAA